MTREKSFEELPENERVFVNVYAITRHYGGPEEGGWWYNRKECVEVFPTRNINAETIAAELEADWSDEKYGDISSMAGGQDIQIWIELTAKESEKLEVPRYE